MSDPHDSRDPDETSASIQRIWLVAHDLKNSFSLMSYAFHELPRHLAGGDAAKLAFTELRTLLGHVDLLAAELLDSLRAQSDGRTAVALNDFLVERESILTRTLGAGVSLNLRPAAAGGVVLATVPELERLLFALVSNACIAMPAGGDLTIATTWIDHTAYVKNPNAWPRRYLRLSVADTGDGLDRGAHVRLLEPLPGDASAADAERDSVISAVRRLHGWVIVESDEDAGTRVHVFLPAVPEPPDLEPDSPPVTS